MIASTRIPPKRTGLVGTTRHHQQLEAELEERYRKSIAHARELAMKQSEYEVVRLRVREEVELAARQDEVRKRLQEDRLKRHCDWMRRRPAPLPVEKICPASPTELVFLRLLAGFAASGSVLAFALRSNPGWFGWSTAIVAFVMAVSAPSLVPLVSKRLLKWRPSSVESAYSVAIPACALSLMTGVLLLWKGPRLPKAEPETPVEARTFVVEAASESTLAKRSDS